MHPLKSEHGPKVPNKDRARLVHLSIHSITNRVCIDMEARMVIQLSANMRDILGFAENIIRGVTLRGDRPPDLEQGFNALYVYSDLILPQLVGDAHAPLLRTVPLDTREGHIKHKSFTHVQYRPVMGVNFETVEIFIRRDNGQPVPFETGKVITTLHFKRIK